MGLVGQNTNQFNNLVLTLGCRWVYVSTKLALENGQKYSYNNIGINESLPSGTTYQYTGNDYYSRTSFTGGFLIGGGNITIGLICCCSISTCTTFVSPLMLTVFNSFFFFRKYNVKRRIKYPHK